MLWVVQTNFSTDADDPNWIRKACEKHGYEFKGVKVVPFSDEIVEPENDFTIFYGGTGWVNKIYEKFPTHRGIFLIQKVFSRIGIANINH